MPLFTILEKVIAGTKRKRDCTLVFGVLKLGTFLAVVNHLCSEPTLVVVSQLNAKNNMLSKKDGLSHRNKRLLGLIGFGEILRSVKQRQQKYGGQLVLVSEAYSTMRCSCCGHVNSPGTSKTFQCSWKGCMARMDRDENSARNVLMVRTTSFFFFSLFYTNIFLGRNSSSLTNY